MIDLHTQLDQIEATMRNPRVMGDSGIRISGSLMSGLKVDMDVAEEVVDVVTAGVVTPGTGACCVGTDCTIETQADCEGMGGTYIGDNTTCDPDPCACCPFTTIEVSGSISLANDCGVSISGSNSALSYTQGIDFVSPDGFFAQAQLAMFDGVCDTIPECCDEDPPPPDCVPDPACEFYDPLGKTIEISCSLTCGLGFINVSPGAFIETVHCAEDCNLALNSGFPGEDIPCDELIGTHTFTITSGFGLGQSGTLVVVVTFS